MAGIAALGGMAAMGGPADAPPTTCVLMKNMFDPNGEDEKNDPEFFEDLMEGVKEDGEEPTRGYTGGEVGGCGQRRRGGGRRQDTGWRDVGHGGRLRRAAHMLTKSIEPSA